MPVESERRHTDYDSLTAQARDELLERLQFFRLDPRVVVDLGSGPGLGTTALRRKFRGAQVLAVDADFAQALAARRRQRFWRSCDAICADACTLPLQSQSVDLIFSNLLLPHCSSPPRLFAQVQRVLRPGGLVVFSTLGPGALQQLRARRTDIAALAVAANDFDMPRLGAAMAESGLSEPVLDCERRAVEGRSESIEVIYGAAFGGGARGGTGGPGADGSEYTVPLDRFRTRGKTS
jgi:malonyl-CoA O-methyltransferase